MKKFLWIFFILILAANLSVLADEYSTSGDLWDNFGDQNTYGQKPVTDEEFEKVLKQKKIKRNFFGKEIKDKNIPKGEEFQQSNETNYINEVQKELPVVLVPVEVIVDENTVMPIGHYQIVGEKKDGEVYLKFYQAHSLIAKLRATETEDDFQQERINFASWLENGADKIKFIYGSLDFNAYVDAYINK